MMPHAPTEGPIPWSVQEQVRDSLIGLIKRKAVSRPEMAKILGCSRPLLSQLLAGTYKGKSEKYFRRAMAWFRRRRPDSEGVSRANR